jgi:hypothetical protein
MKAEFSAIWTLLHFTNKQGVRKLQVQGDSKVVIHWANRKNKVEIVCLKSLLQEI